MGRGLNNDFFQTEDKAREWLEAQLWPSGPICPHCGGTGCSSLRHRRATPSRGFLP